MARTPDGPQARSQNFTLRFSPTERSALREAQAHRGAPNEAAYIRRLIAEDARKIRREQSRG